MDIGPAGKTVLVTGGAGFIGSHLAEALCERNEVRILDDFSSGIRTNVPEGAMVVEGDVREEEARELAMDGVDVVFHQAAQISVERSVEEPATSHSVNAEATVSVLERAREESARVVLASSSAIYGDPEEVPLPEEHPKRPTSPYGIAKLTADHYARLYTDLYDLPTVALRYFNVYGPRQAGADYNGVISAFVEQARTGGPITVHGDGRQTRDFVHVDDVVRANLLAATTDRVGEAYNVGTGERTTIVTLAETIAELIDPKTPITHVEPRVGDVRHSQADISKSRAHLGFDPSVSLRDGLVSFLKAESISRERVETEL